MKHHNKTLVLLSSLLIVFSASSLNGADKPQNISTANAALQVKDSTPDKSNNSDGGFSFDENDKYAEITAYNGTSGFVEIPAEYNGKPVKKAVFKADEKTKSDEKKSAANKIISVTVPDTLEELEIEDTDSLMQICGSKKSCAFDAAKEYGVCFTEIPDYSSYLELSENDGVYDITQIKTDSKSNEYVIPAAIGGKYIASLSGKFKADNEVTLRIENGSIDLSKFTSEGKVTVYGYGGSTAQKFAYRNSLKFIPLDCPDCGCSFKMYAGGAEANIVSADSDIVIPSEWQGLPVTKMNRYLMTPYVRTISIPETVTGFSDSAASKRFVGASTLETIYGVSGSFAESLAEEMKVKFVDISARDFDYEIKSDNVKIKGVKGIVSDIVIPDTIEGKAVTEIDIEVRSDTAKSIAIPDSVTKISLDGSLSGLCIYGGEGSAAQEFASKNKCSFRYAGLPDEAYFHYVYRNDKPDSDKVLYAAALAVCDRTVSVPSEMYGEPVGGISLENIEDEIFCLEIHENIKDIVTEKEPEVIIGKKGSFAQKYAKDKKIAFCSADSEEIPDGIQYALYNNSAEIISLDAYLKDSQSVEIMSYINNRCVTSICDEAIHYTSDKKLEITIPGTVTDISEKAVVCDKDKKKNVKIKGMADSAAEKFAEDNGFEFEEISNNIPKFEYASADKKSEKNTVCGLENKDEFDYKYRISIPQENDGSTIEKIEGFPEKFCPEIISVSFDIPSCIKSIECSDDLSGYNITIYGEQGSYAEKFAAEKNLRFSDVSGQISDTVVYSVKSGNLVCLSKDITSVTVPENAGRDAVKKITKDTFADCSELRTVTVLSPDVEFDKPFADCSKLEEIRGYGGSTAQTYASENGLKFVCLDNISFTSWNDEGTVNAVVPENMSKLGKFDLMGCTALKSVTITDSSLSISDDAFDECPNLSVIYGIKGSSAEQAAKKCGFDFIEIENSSGYIAVSGDDKGYTLEAFDNTAYSADIPQEINGVKVTGIGSGAFDECTNLKAVVLNENISKIAENAFAECTQLEKVTIMNADAEISKNAFPSDAKSLTICGAADSTAEKYAKDNKLEFAEVKSETKTEKTTEKNKDSEKTEPEETTGSKDEKDGKTDISDAVIYVDAIAFAYDGKPHTASCKIVMGDKTLKEGTDYKLNGKSAQEAGQHMLTATGLGDYKGSVAAVWRICKTCEVTVNINGTKSKTVYEENTNAEVEATDIDGKKFSHWECDGKNVSTSRKYSFTAEKNISLTAVYTDEKSETAETTNAKETTKETTSATTKSSAEKATSASVHTEKAV